MSALGEPLSRWESTRAESDGTAASDERLAGVVLGSCHKGGGELGGDQVGALPEVHQEYIRSTLSTLSCDQVDAWRLQRVEQGAEVLLSPRQVGDLVDGGGQVSLHELDNPREAVEHGAVELRMICPLQELHGKVRDPEWPRHQIRVKAEALAVGALGEDPAKL